MKVIDVWDAGVEIWGEYSDTDSRTRFELVNVVYDRIFPDDIVSINDYTDSVFRSMVRYGKKDIAGWD